MQNENENCIIFITTKAKGAVVILICCHRRTTLSSCFMVFSKWLAWVVKFFIFVTHTHIYACVINMSMCVLCMPAHCCHNDHCCLAWLYSLLFIVVIHAYSCRLDQVSSTVWSIFFVILALFILSFSPLGVKAKVVPMWLPLIIIIIMITTTTTCM